MMSTNGSPLIIGDAAADGEEEASGSGSEAEEDEEELLDEEEEMRRLEGRAVGKVDTGGKGKGKVRPFVFVSANLTWGGSNHTSLTPLFSSSPPHTGPSLLDPTSPLPTTTYNKPLQTDPLLRLRSAPRLPLSPQPPHPHSLAKRTNPLLQRPLRLAYQTRRFPARRRTGGLR